ncbi:MAG: prepilin-type N-terminal cleavage/methylation domain-containing protein [Planctomycetota bacterium]|nr:MAG: prepilin-type N-terminal cleavage/methylation domain-containing protein [Planctomycetota bacterium]
MTIRGGTNVGLVERAAGEIESMQRRPGSHGHRRGVRVAAARGFTLVEMLVSVALVSLVLVMFAEIFQIASNSMTVQRGIAANDRRVRMVVNTIRDDLSKRTFRVLIPYDRSELTYGIDTFWGERLGYFYVSENTLESDADDVLQFTVRSYVKRRNDRDEPYIGRAVCLPADPSVPAWSASTNYSAGDRVVPTAAAASRKFCPVFVCVQGGTSGATEPAWGSGSVVVDGPGPVLWRPLATLPDMDDGIVGNDTAESAYAEVSYFLRHGNLYRRVLLLRDPPDGQVQPLDQTTGLEYFDPGNTAAWSAYTANRNFWADFDFSAHGAAGGAYNTVGVKFHGPGSLLNVPAQKLAKWRAGTAYSVGDVVVPLSNTAGTAGLLYRCVVAGVSGGTEPSWPTSAGGSVADGTAAWQAQAMAAAHAGTVSEAPLGIPSYRFGHDRNTGLPKEFLELPGGGFAFIGRFTHEETSHPFFKYPQSASTDGAVLINDGNPMQPGLAGTNPLTLGNDGVVDRYRGGPRRAEDLLLTDVLSFDVKLFDPGLGQFADVGHNAGVAGMLHQSRNRSPQYGPLPGSNNRVFDTWHPAIPYLAGWPGSLVQAPFRPQQYASSPGVPGVPLAGRWQPNTIRPGGYSAGDVVFPTHPNGDLLYYVALNSGVQGGTEPSWPTKPGQTVVDGGVVWQARSNLVPIPAIQITIRFLDESSGQIRQTTIVQSLTD